MDTHEPAPGRDGIGLTRDTYVLLAQANLLRMRGCWEEAVENCMAVLRLTPDSHSAQSLLGDIYDNQGRSDDAIQWYRMALDLNPQSSADRMKLERLLHLQREGTPQARPSVARANPAYPDPQSLPASEDIEDTSLLGSRRPRLRLKWDLVLRITALTAALLTFVVVASAYVSVHRHAALSALGLSPAQEMKTPLLVVSSADASPPATVPTGTLRDASEQSLLDALRASPDLNAAGVVVYDVEAEPRTAKLTLTYGQAQGASGAVGHETVLRSALRLVRAASALPGAQSTELFTMRFLTPQANGGSPASASLAFVGDVSRESLPPSTQADAGLSAEQVQALFGSPWWSTQLPG